MFSECRGESVRHRHVPQPPSFRYGHVALPLGPLNAELSLLQINVCPLQRISPHRKPASPPSKTMR